MAIDSALLDLGDEEGAAFLRLYRWAPFCLSFGRHEPAARRYDRARIESLGLDCVRRPTGGRAVWHARELTYAVTAPLACFGGMRAAYQQIHAMLAAALASLGGSPALAPDHKPLAPGSGPCFSSPVGGEVLLAGQKVIGSAQLRQGNAFLQHGSLLLEDDQSLPRSLAGAESSAKGEAPLSQLLGRLISFEQAVSAIIAAAEASFGNLAAANGRTSLMIPRPRVRQHAARFQDPAWTWQR